MIYFYFYGIPLQWLTGRELAYNAVCAWLNLEQCHSKDVGNMVPDTIASLLNTPHICMAFLSTQTSNKLRDGFHLE